MCGTGRYKRVPDESMIPDGGVPKKEFSIARKGYEPEEVDGYLAEYDVAFRELEEYAARLKQELAEARSEIRRLEVSAQASMDNAMQAVFDAKERIMERARQKALQIQNEARVASGMAPVAVESVDTEYLDDGSDLTGSVGLDTPSAQQRTDDESSPAVAVTATEGPDPTEVLRQMLTEAESIRTRLESGLASAFGEMERMQHDAEARAAELLEDARIEAAMLRRAGETAGKTHPKPSEPKVEVTLTPEGSAEVVPGERRSRYSRNSAKLPSIGEDAGGSVLSSMNQLRSKLREAEEVALQVKDPSAS